MLKIRSFWKLDLHTCQIRRVMWRKKKKRKEKKKEIEMGRDIY